jgi:hypothetical protein
MSAPSDNFLLHTTIFLGGTMKLHFKLGLLKLSLLAITISMILMARDTKSLDDSRLDWWREARFGMFIHWGPVSLKGTEIGWSRGNQVPVEEYDNLYKKFNPTQFDADAWVRIARQAGMKYMVLTSKHHDGFCLWDSK